MGIGIGIFLLAVGAVLAFAVHVTVAGVSLVTIGWILMVVGVIGLVLGTFVGGHGTRVNAVMSEVGEQEKIDIIVWSDETIELPNSRRIVLRDHAALSRLSS